jgi:hypothetical protein
MATRSPAESGTPPNRPRATLARTLADVESELSIRDEIARDEWQLRKELSREILSSFFYVNRYLLLGLGAIFFIETAMIAFTPNSGYKRILETKVLIALVSAITVQFGAIAFGVSTWLFPKSRSEKSVRGGPETQSRGKQRGDSGGTPNASL